MPSSTSSSSDGFQPGMYPARAADPVYERPVPALGHAALLGLIVGLLLMIAWEGWVRSEWVEPSYRNSDGLWAEQRRRVTGEAARGWVFAGSSRVLWNMQLDVWERLDGQRPIQLALEGTTPALTMEQLADDPEFTGMLLVGIAPDLTFTGYGYRAPAVERYLTETPSERFGQQVSVLVEPYLAFYHTDFALGTILRRQHWPGRGVPEEPDIRKLGDMGRDRNMRMFRRVYEDPVYNKITTDNWAVLMPDFSQMPPEALEGIAAGRKAQVDRLVAVHERLKANGVTVVFVRMPSDGKYPAHEAALAPRAEAWDQLIERTGAIGLHWLDHEEMQGYKLEEWSHMSGETGDRFTESFYGLVQRKLAEREG